ncbi:hypothetical protein ACE40V_24000, partial [Salmonella enterica]
MESKPNKGSTFSFCIDYQVSKSKKQSSISSAEATSNTSTAFDDKAILLVEDNVINQKVAVSYLSHWGFKSDIANNGAEALDMMTA